jgi:hypothetical protein
MNPKYAPFNYHTTTWSFFRDHLALLSSNDHLPLDHLPFTCTFQWSFTTSTLKWSFTTSTVHWSFTTYTPRCLFATLTLQWSFATSTLQWPFATYRPMIIQWSFAKYRPLIICPSLQWPFAIDQLPNDHKLFLSKEYYSPPLFIINPFPLKYTKLFYANQWDSELYRCDKININHSISHTVLVM